MPDSNNNELITRFPIVKRSVDTSGVKIRLRDLYQRIMKRPVLELVEVTAVSSPTITIRYIGTTVDVPGVRCVGWGTITLPVVGDYVWVLRFDGVASGPIAIGKQ